MVKIGVLDSGVGGFSVLRPLLERFPGLSAIYVADTAHVPYSDRSPRELQGIIRKILRFFSIESVDAVVFACNTSSAIVLPQVERDAFAPFYGVVRPGVKGALLATRGRGIGVAANDVTARSGVFGKLIHERNRSIKVIEQACGRLVSFVENGDLDSRETFEAVAACCDPFVGKIDTLVFGCTHFPFLKDQFARILGDVMLVDPAAFLVEEFAAAFPQAVAKTASDPEHRLLATRHSPHVGEWAEKMLGWKRETEFLDLDSFTPWQSGSVCLSEKKARTC